MWSLQLSLRNRVELVLCLLRVLEITDEVLDLIKVPSVAKVARAESYRCEECSDRSLDEGPHFHRLTAAGISCSLAINRGE